MIARLIAVGAVLLCGCRQRLCTADADASLAPHISPIGPHRPCLSDSDCAAGSLCACTSSSCSVAPNFQPQVGEPDGLCIRRIERLVLRLPIRAGGGWILEGHPAHKWFPTNLDALEDPWRVEYDDKLELEIRLLSLSADAGR